MSRSTKMGAGGNITTNGNTYNFNKYTSGGIGASSIATRNAKNRLASFCKTDCAGPTLTILVYNTTQGSSFAWSGVTFTRNTNLPNFSYSATITSIPASHVPSLANLIGVTIGNIVTSIGNYAFEGCTALTSVIFTSTSTLVTIGVAAFYNCAALTSITIPSSVTTIGNSAFFGCTAFTSITIPSSVTSIGNFVFNDCTGLTTVYISNATAAFLGNLISPPQTWTSPSTVSSPYFYNAPNSVSFLLPL